MEFLKSLAVLLFGMLVLNTSAQDILKQRNAFSESYIFEKGGEYTKAIESIKDVYEDDSYIVNLRLGWLNYMAGFFTESLAYYQKAINLKPLSIEAKFGYTYPASALGNWEQVKKQYNDILRIDPQNTPAHFKLGSIYYGNEDFEQASIHYEKVVNLYPFDYDGLLMYAWTNLRLGKYREAEVLFNQVLLYDPDDKSAKEGLAEIK